MGEIQISKAAAYVSEGPDTTIAYSKVGLYVSEGPPLGTSRIMKTMLYISEGPKEENGRRRNFMSFAPG